MEVPFEFTAERATASELGDRPSITDFFDSAACTATAYDGVPSVALLSVIRRVSNPFYRSMVHLVFTAMLSRFSHSVYPHLGQ